MPTITFEKAQKALGHLNHNGQGDKPPLLEVSGWDKSKVVYGVKSTIEEAFKTEIERFKDLAKERQQIQQEVAQSDSDRLSDKQIKRLTEINDELEELFEQEQEFELEHQFTEEDFGDVIDSGMFIDLEFAIETE